MFCHRGFNVADNRRYRKLCPNCAVPNAVYEQVDVSTGEKTNWWHCIECNYPLYEEDAHARQSKVS